MSMGGDDDEQGATKSALDDDVHANALRDRMARVALELATTPEGRAASLSVEVWPARGVWLSLPAGHELRVSVERRDEALQVFWERLEPTAAGGPSRSTEGRLISAQPPSDDDVRVLISAWVHEHAR
jgi:hypothetical protein